MAADTSHHIIGLIPSRWGSSRFPGKPLHPIAGKPLVQHVWDEPLIDPALIDRLAEALVSDEALSMATVACPISAQEDLDNPNIVKVALARNGDALYFSRSVIPYARHPRVAPPLRHLGIYAYRRDFLENYVRWAPTPLEQTESLEQLRALENGARIRVILTDHVSVGVDTPEQAEQVEQILLNIH